MYSDELKKREINHTSYESWQREKRMKILMACIEVFTQRDHDLHEIIYMRCMYKEPMKWKEIAQKLGLTIGQCKYKYRIAMHKIRKELEKE